jgi:hypothetical protein
MNELLESVEQNNTENNQDQQNSQNLEQNQPQDSGNQTEQTTTSWYIDENIPGTGERPEWLKEKYKSATDQAKAYTELEKRLGAFKGAPDEYDLSLEGEEFENVKIDKENPVLQEFLEDAKKNNVSQQYVSQMLKSYAKMQKMQQPNFDKELEKLGPTGKQDLQVLLQWGNNNLSSDEISTFKSMVKTADDVRLFEKIRRIATRAETQPSNTRTPFESEAKIRQMIHDPRYDTDPIFRAEVREKLAQIKG